MITIRNRWTNEVLLEDPAAETLKDAVVRAIANRANLEDANLEDANLVGANLEDANLEDANLEDANLYRANLVGANLVGANLYRANLYRANLVGANLYRANLYRANLVGANLYRANLEDANLYRANLEDANLEDANLYRANLEDAKGIGPDGKPIPLTEADYLELAARYRARHPDVPVVPLLDSKICDVVTSGLGNLNMRTWHECDTTHCRAGWAIHLAGPAGYALEEKHGPHMAGMMIYRASTGRIPNFFADNESALKDVCEWGTREKAALSI